MFHWALTSRTPCSRPKKKKETVSVTAWGEMDIVTREKKPLEGWRVLIWSSVNRECHRLGVTIVKPVVYGNVARYFGKKREEDGHTHQWTVYVKPYRNEDMSTYVKKIQFKLHESYGNPLRVVTKPPYEITETGWGEFEIIIKIFFIDPNERPVTLYHLLKLFQSDTNAMLGKKTVVSEFYDEMIFQDPTAMMQQLLTTSRQLTLGAYKHETEFAELEVKTREKLEAAKKKTSFEIAELKERLKASRETINCLKNEIRKLEEDDQTKEI
ncbi:YEATS domain-containing protein 4 isoform X1 [Tamandua tetradactyla]|uniref:YEATS domain-containing protein 4 isoform X1 n=1 Tax=Tamandua tetradactyla TaxID=48850 RepID=UPI004053D9A9